MLIQVDIWLRRAELLQSLLGSGIAASLDDISDKESSAHLRDRLIRDERYSMAVYTCKKCKVRITIQSFRLFHHSDFQSLVSLIYSNFAQIDVFPVWNAWGHALIRMEHYPHARVKFKYAVHLVSVIDAMFVTTFTIWAVIIFCLSLFSITNIQASSTIA